MRRDCMCIVHGMAMASYVAFSRSRHDDLTPGAAGASAATTAMVPTP